MADGIVLTSAELEALTGYRLATRQLEVLHRRGFTRAYIARTGAVVLERTHYEAVTRGEAQASSPGRKSANLAFLRQVPAR